LVLAVFAFHSQFPLLPVAHKHRRTVRQSGIAVWSVLMFEDFRAELEVAVEQCGRWLRQVRGALLRSLLVGSIVSGYTLGINGK
jgi:hypothetical protein